MTDDQWANVWRIFHEASRLNRYQRQELDALEAMLKATEAGEKVTTP